MVRRSAWLSAAVLPLAVGLAGAGCSSPSRHRSPTAAVAPAVVPPLDEGVTTTSTAVDPAVDGAAAADAVAPAPAVFDGPPATVVPPPASLQHPFAGVEAQPGVWAVVVGINDYPGRTHDLRWADADADDMVAALRSFGVPGDHIVSLRDGGAPAATIALAADWLVAHAGKDATAVFSYQGHVRKLDTDREAVVGADGNLLTDTDLASHLAGLQARHTWLSMATCFGGGFTEMLGPGRVLTAAADANHLAYENSALDRSYYGEFLVREGLLQGKADSSVQAAYGYAYSTIHQRYPGREPFETGAVSDVIDLRTPGVPHTAAVAASSGGSSGPPASGGTGGTGGSPPPPPTSPPPPPATTTTTDGCAWATVGVVTCGPHH